MPALTPYDTGDRLEPKIWLPYGTEVTPATPAENFGKVDFEDDSGETVCVVYVERTDDGTFALHVEPLCADDEIEVQLHLSRLDIRASRRGSTTTLRAQQERG